MRLIQTAIPDVVIIEPTVFEDNRGWFLESFNEGSFLGGLKNLNLPVPSRFVQDNHSCSKKNVLRGLHYQHSPFGQGKLVRAIRGAIYDVAVDIREDSPTYCQHVGVQLSASNNRMLWIPEGFAHGFLALEDDSHVLYKVTGFHNKQAELSIKWDDVTLDINWPLSAIPIISDKDNLAPYFEEMYKSIQI